MNEKIFFKLEDEQRHLYRDSRIAIKGITATAEYAVNDKKPKAWTISFKYLTWVDQSYFGRNPDSGWLGGSIRIEKGVSMKEAVEIAFSRDYWYSCTPIYCIEPRNSYFYFDGQYMCTIKGYKSCKVARFLESEYLVRKEEFLRDVVEDAKKRKVKLPEPEDIIYLYSLYEYLGYVGYGECDKKSCLEMLEEEAKHYEAMFGD